ncbi:hypothetical protein J6590_051250 [Homalodisca vitripennis]|nr:hypothetical protein J6590_051250 [Homalodisca vitripennis]
MTSRPKLLTDIEVVVAPHRAGEVTLVATALCVAPGADPTEQSTIRAAICGEI